MKGYLLGYTDEEVDAHIFARAHVEKPVTS
jgi:hypothetical protein